MKGRAVIIGGGVSGLAAAGFLHKDYDCTLIEKEAELGGYCRTISKNGFVWDYSGHFFHFRNQWVSDYIHRNISPEEIRSVNRVSTVRIGDRYIDAPLQYHIDQLPKLEMLECLADIYEAQATAQSDEMSFMDMLRRRYGSWLTKAFLQPYNEKLYGISLDELDRDAMGRFFPHVDFAELLRLMARRETKASYNQHFTYHSGGARAYVTALAAYVPQDIIRLGVPCERIDLERRRIRTPAGDLDFDHLITSAPLPHVLAMAGVDFPTEAFTANKVRVFNIGFDRPSIRNEHWIYFPGPEWPFYRVGFYSNIISDERMSIYVEISLGNSQDPSREPTLSQVIECLRNAGIVTDHKILEHSSVLMDPGYVHIRPGLAQLRRHFIGELNKRNVYPIGRYGEWTYCSIEDNIVAARRLADKLTGRSTEENQA